MTAQTNTPYIDVDGTSMKMKTSEYFQRSCWIAVDPDDKMTRLSR